MPLADGVLLGDGALAIVTNQQLFGETARQSRRRKRSERDPDTIIRQLNDLQPGSPVVHAEYGVGRYRGLITLEAGGIAGEFLHLEYADGDKLYVPVHALDLITRYTGAAADSAPLHRLGSDQWAKARRRAMRKIRDAAAELLDIYARRAARPGHRFNWPESAQVTTLSLSVYPDAGIRTLPKSLGCVARNTDSCRQLTHCSRR